MFDADRPITKSDQDRLNRAPFAKYLARCIVNHKDPESLVIGLYGGWGVGKTSLLNLVLEELQYAGSNMFDEEKPIILNFSPWSYSGQHQLIYSFFRRLSSALRAAPYLENADRIIHLLELYVSFFTQKPVPHSLRTKRSFLEKITFRGHEDVYAWESGRDLTLVKAELNELLRHQKHKIIIIIDNISRLHNDEIKQMFQIIKSMGDYANTAYLLAFDKEQVITAINKVDGSGGEQLVEKIVQLPFNVPPILQQDIESIFADRLNEVVATVPEGTWNMEQWADIYYSSLKLFFENCRDITRYVNTLSFSYSRSRDLVDPVDFFALTAIEVFLPDVYAGIRDNKDLFTDLLDNVYILDADQQQKDKLRCDEIIKRSTQIPHEIIFDLLLHLFPRLRRIYLPEEHVYHSAAMARELKRICSPDSFDAYFRLSMQGGQILTSEFNTLLSMVSDNVAFDQALTRLNQDERIIKFLDLLDTRSLQTIPSHYIHVVINALMDNGDLFPPGVTGLLSLDTPMRIHRIIHALLRRLKTTDERFAVLEKAIQGSSKSLYILVHELKESGREHMEDEDSFIPLEFRDVTPQQLQTLQQLVLAKIADWAQTGRLAEHPKLMPILFAWNDWANNDDCRQFVAEMTSTDKGLVIFLTAALELAINEAMTKYEKTSLWDQCLTNIVTFVSVDKIEKRAVAIFEDNYFEKLREREQLAVMIFLDLIKANTAKVIPRTV